MDSCAEKILFSLAHLVGDRDLVFEEEAQHFPRGVRSSRIGEGAGGAAARPRVCGSMDFPMLKDCAAARVRMDRSGIGMSSRDPTAMHRFSRVCGSLRPRDDMIGVARMYRGVVIAVKNDGRDRLPISENRRNMAGLQNIRQVTLPHGDKR